MFANHSAHGGIPGIVFGDQAFDEVVGFLVKALESWEDDPLFGFMMPVHRGKQSLNSVPIGLFGLFNLIQKLPGFVMFNFS